MAFFDMSLEELRQFKPDVRIPDNFDEFWKATLSESQAYSLNTCFERVDYGLKLVDVFDVTFAGYKGQSVKAWFVLPKNHTGKLPCVVEFIGYGGGRGFGFEHLLWANMGFAYLIMDTRGQGSAWRHGDTPDIPDGANAFYPGFMTQGILDPETYYYRRVFVDAVRAIEVARSHEAVDSQHIALTGASQGGGITIAAGALVPDVEVLMPDVPFLCHYEQAIAVTISNPYEEIRQFLKIHRDKTEIVFNTLSYFDGVNFAKRTKTRVLYSVGMMDLICPPSTVFAAYNHVPSLKDIVVYQYNDHEGGQEYQLLEKMKYLQNLWKK